MTTQEKAYIADTFGRITDIAATFWRQQFAIQASMAKHYSDVCRDLHEIVTTQNEKVQETSSRFPSATD